MYKRLHILLLFALLLAGYRITAQDSLRFQPMFGSLPLQTETFYHLGGNDSIRFDVVRFYISGIEFCKDGKTTWKETNSFHLVDLSEPKTLNIHFAGTTGIIYNEISFHVGIDSATNTAGVMGGDLDPAKGMYWAWQSGYINFKIEGKSNRCISKNKEFQFHLGGYESPFNALQTVHMPTNKCGLLQIDLQALISKLHLEKLDHIMSPGQAAVELSKEIPLLFSMH